METKRILIHKARKLRYYKEITFSRVSRTIMFYYEYLDENNDIIRKIHNNLNKPAVLSYYNGKVVSMEYWYKGNRHRLNAPAILDINGKEILNEEWYHDGKKLSEDDVKHIEKLISRRRKIIYLTNKMHQK